MKKYFFAATLFLTLFACGSKEVMQDKPIELTTDSREAKNTKPKEEIINIMPQGDQMTKARGTVRDKTSEEGCNYLLEVITKDNDTLMLDGGQLPVQFRTEGTVIDFTYRFSKRPSTCLLGLPIYIDRFGD